MHKHPLPGFTREGRHGLPVLRRLYPGIHGEEGDAMAAVAEPSSAPPPPEEEPMPPEPAPPGWWTEPYKGGPMVPVAGFPRPLYPPDAAAKGKSPSIKGPDVVAYKRTICRLGRWAPWDPSAWDEAYSNAFSHGRGTGMVGDTGVAGVQRQQNLDPTGWLGEKTFNTLRSARVPTGPHAGEMAMDSVAVNLIAEAYALFREPPALTPDDVAEVMTDYLVRSIKSASRWHYSQARAMSNFGKAPEEEQWSDCSGQATSVFYFCMQELDAPVPDPNRYAAGFGSYSGYGYTGTLIAAPRCSAPWRVGDLAIYGKSTSSTSHVVTCYVAGDDDTAEWCSNGSEEAPYAVELHYRADLLHVVRPGLLVA